METVHFVMTQTLIVGVGIAQFYIMCMLVYYLLCMEISSMSGHFGCQCYSLAKITRPVYLLANLERAPLWRKNFLFYLISVHAMFMLFT